MPAGFVLVVGVALVATATSRRVHLAVGALAVAVLLVPDTILLPGTPLTYPFSLLTINRLVVWTFAGTQVVRAVTDTARHRLLAPTRVHAAFIAFLAVLVVNGIVLAEPEVPAQSQAARFLLAADQLVLFVGLLTLLRRHPDAVVTTIRVAVVALCAAATIAVLEQATGSSYAAWFTDDLGAQRDRVLRFLETRGGDVRVRTASQFALAFAWTATMLLPLVVVVSGRLRWLVWKLAPVALVGLAIVFTVSRSVVVGAGLALAVVLVASGDRRARIVLGTTAAVGALVFLLSSGLATPFGETRQTTGSVELRETRLGVVAEAVSDDPITGLGLGSLVVRDVRSTDTSYLLTYAETGVIGLVVLVVLLLTAVATAGGALRSPVGPPRHRGTAVMGGLLAGLVGAAAFDLFSVPSASQVFWILAALGAGIAESSRLRRPPDERAIPVRARIGWRAAVPVIAVVSGAIIAIATPTHSALFYRFETLPMTEMAPSASPHTFPSPVLARAACAAAELGSGPDSDLDADISCRLLPGNAGMGEVRVEARSEREALAVGEITRDRIERSMPYKARTFDLAPPESGRPTWARTAPVWAGLLALAMVLLVPPRPWRNRLRRLERVVSQGPRSRSLDHETRI